MQELLRERLHSYIVENNPDIIIMHSGEKGYQSFLNKSIGSIKAHLERGLKENRLPRELENECMDMLTTPLRPSRFQYVSEVLATEFYTDYGEMREAGILTYEVINMMSCCEDEFETFGFNEETEDDRFLRYAVIARISDYLNGERKENINSKSA